jgi:hypothetical protein
VSPSTLLTCPGNTNLYSSACSVDKETLYELV